MNLVTHQSLVAGVPLPGMNWIPEHPLLHSSFFDLPHMTQILRIHTPLSKNKYIFNEGQLWYKHWKGLRCWEVEHSMREGSM